MIRATVNDLGSHANLVCRALELGSSRPVAERITRMVELLHDVSGAGAVALVGAEPDGTPVVLASRDYELNTLRHLLSQRFTEGCEGFRAVRSRPSDLLMWDDLRTFRESFSAQEVFIPSGFRNGVSALVGHAGMKGAGVLHVSFMESNVDEDALLMLDAVRSLIGAWVELSQRFACARLSSRELQVLGMIRDGRTNLEIARDLYISPRTVATHVDRLLRKLRVANRTAAAILADRAGVV